MAKRSPRKVDGWKSKQWFSVVTPEMMGQQEIGETPASDPKLLMGRIIEITLGDVTNDMSKQNVKMSLMIDQVGGDSAYTKFMGHELTRDYIRSLVKRQTSMITSYMDVMTKDGYKVRLKPTCFTIKRAKTSQIKAIRQLMTTIVRRKAQHSEFNTFIQDAVMGKLSAQIYRDVKGIYPLRRVEVLKTRLLSEPEGVAKPIIYAEPEVDIEAEVNAEPEVDIEAEVNAEPEVDIEAEVSADYEMNHPAS
ncbi:MAG: 30S ribosomal protein S3ae [ANME-2 cluster archaeon]|nr:30S ribosomal protein S3ae [ANME-2 cluster archaeon]